MEKQPWPAKYQQSVLIGLERRDELLNNGNSDDLPATDEINGNVSEGKCDKNLVKDELEAAIGEKSKIKIQSILDQVNTLIPIEKLLLYLKLPTENANHVDPLRQPLNPLGSRTEISQTIMWIKTHLEEDQEISLQKKGVYEEYVQFCEPKNIKPLSTADFGKVMKQVYPKVRPRRLGTRGNSQYCYSGLRKRIKLSPPILPDLSEKPLSTEPPCNQNDLFAAAWTIVKEWSENKLAAQFQNLHSLAYHLIKNFSVGLGTSSALLIASAAQSQLRGDMSNSINSSRHKETIRKIQQKCENRDQKRKLQTPQLKIEPKSRPKKPKMQQQQQRQASTSSSTSPIAVSEIIKTSPSQGLQPVCDKSLDFTNLQALPDFSSFQRTTGSENNNNNCDATVAVAVAAKEVAAGDGNAAAKVPIPRLPGTAAIAANKRSPALSPKRTKNLKYKHIQPKPEQCDIASYNPQPILSVADARSQDARHKKTKRKELISGSIPPLDEDQSAVHFSRERLISIGNVSKDALDDYLGTNNSQENEEELMKYFENDNNQEHDSAKKQKLSQLRLLLEQNCVAAFPPPPIIDDSNNKLLPTPFINKDSIERPLLPQLQSAIGSARRRVSFDTHTYEDNNVPPSPNTRRKNFSFTPISPGPHSPPTGGRQSKCSSTNASPFVSPRNTPVPRARGNSHPYPGSNSSVNLGLNRKLPPGKKIELNLDVVGQKNLPMSAPPSPKTNLLQNILNSNQKYPYTPNYSAANLRCGGVVNNIIEQLSPEVSTLLPINNQQQLMRSQSVPLNVVSSSACFTHFPFNIEQETAQVQNDFTDMDAFPENINVNKIIDTIDQSNLGTLLDDGNLQQTEFCSVMENFCPLRTNNQAATTTTTIDEYMKCNPSRSVPSTPIPSYSKTQTEPPLKIDHYSRSYPSTPLANNNESFNYNQTQDYLLNGQPIKEKILDEATTTDLNLLNIVKYENIFQVDGSLISDSNFDGQMAPEPAVSFGAKQGVVDPVVGLNQECLIENDYFKGVSDMGRS